MKKVFALFMVIALLAVTGSAFAAELVVNADDVTVKAGSSRSSTVTAEKAHDEGKLEYEMTSGLEWATFSGSTVTFSPTTSVPAGNYTVTVRATETYTPGDNAGHSPVITTGEKIITVTVEAPTFTTNLAVNPASFPTLRVGETATATITAAATEGLDGTLNYSISSPYSWVSLVGNTITLRPNEAVNNFAVTVSARETAGVYNNTVTATISGTVLEGKKTDEEKAKDQETAGGAESIEVTKAEQVSEIVEKIENISMTVLVGDTRVVVDITPELLQQVLAADTKSTLAKLGVPEASADVIAGKTEEYKKLIAEDFDAEVANNNDVTWTAPDGTAEEKSAAMSVLLAQILDSAGVEASSDVPVFGGFTMELKDDDASGGNKVVSVSNSFSTDLWGMLLKGYVAKETNKKNASTYGEESSQSFGIKAAAISGASEMIFLNSSGARVNRIPGENNEGIVPGLVTMVMVLEPGAKHTPVVTVDNNELPAELKAESKQVEVEVVRLVEATFTEQSNSFFSTNVSWDLIANTDYTNGYEYYRISDDAGGRVNHVTIGDDWTRTDEDNAAMTSNPSFDLTRVVRLPALIGTNETEDNVYIVKVNFQISDANRAKILASADNGAFVFFPNGPQKASARSRVTKAVEGPLTSYLETMKPEELKSSSVTEGYLSFIIPAGETLEKPMLAVRLRKTAEPGPEPDEFYITASDTAVTVTLNNTDVVTYTATNASGDVTYSISPSADWVALTTVDNEATVTILPTDSALVATSPHMFTITAIDEAGNTDSESLSITVTRQSSRPSSSGGGGCSAGFSAMALAVLGAFIARRKK